MTVGRIVGEPIRVHRIAAGAEVRGAGAGAPRHGGAAARASPTATRTSCRGGQRQRVGIARALAVGPAARGRRRGGLGARRLGARADPEPARGAARAPGPGLPLRLPRPGRDPLREPPGGGDVPGQARGGGARPPSCSSSRCTPTRRRCWPRSRRWATAATSIFDDPTRLLEGELPNPIDLPRGCRFASRCPHRMARCDEAEPALREAAPGHAVACYLYTEGGGSS